MGVIFWKWRTVEIHHELDISRLPISESIDFSPATNNKVGYSAYEQAY
jgi:hypothetical protein